GLGSLRVVTSMGIMQWSVDKLYVMVTQWIRDLSLFIVKGGRIDETLDMAARCNRAYAERCHFKGNTDTVRDIGLDIDLDTDLDPECAMAKEMLREDVCHSQLFLGIRATEIGTLVEYLPLIVSRTDSVLAERLTEVVNSYLASS
ncbi:hypothetical protein FBU31_001660, partial [Coemansia sp. 'formosensis']